MLLIDVPSNESQFSSSNTTLFGFEMQGPSITSSQFGQPSVVAPANQNINVVSYSFIESVYKRERQKKREKKTLPA